MAFCYQCGKPISEQAKFCPYCGYHLEPKKPTPKPVVIEEEKPEMPKGKKGKKDKQKGIKAGKTKAKAEEPAFDVEEDFTQKAPASVAYTVDHTTVVPAQPVAVQRTPDNPLPSRDEQTTPMATETTPIDEDRFGWIWIVVGIIILIVVLIVVWALLFSG